MFRIKPHEGNKYGWGYATHNDIRMYLGFAYNAKLPMDYSNVTRVPLTDNRTTKLVIHKGTRSLNGRQGKSSKHRCFAECPDCKAMVPAGRTIQHKCK